MTEIAFHFNLPDKIAYACRLLRKAVSAGMKVVVKAEPNVLQQLDADLWTFSPLDFVSHCLIDSAPNLVSASAVVLTLDAQLTAHHQVLLNLGFDVPEGFAGYDRLIEVVGPDGTDIEAARKRWRFYAARGYTIVRHDLAK